MMNMRGSMPPLPLILAVVVSAAQPVQGAAEPVPEPAASDPCSVSYRAMLDLGIRGFDQDMNGGWRALARRPECREEAADLIKTYREFLQSRMRTLNWHEAQLRAELGQAEQAIALMERSRHQPIEHGQDQGDWNAYVDATIAFMRGDRPALLAARERLARFPVPEGYRYVDANGVERTGRPPGWPYNLDVVDALIRCLGRPYGEAYGSAQCREPPRQ